MPDNLAASKRITLAEVLDRVLDKGVVVKGDLVISVADVDLIYIGLQLVISAVDKLYDYAGDSAEWDDAG